MEPTKREHYSIPVEIIEASRGGASKPTDRWHWLKIKLETIFKGTALANVNDAMLLRAMGQDPKTLTQFLGAATCNPAWTAQHKDLYQRLVDKLLSDKNAVKLVNRDLLERIESDFPESLNNKSLLLIPENGNLPEFIQAGKHFTSRHLLSLGELSPAAAASYRAYLEGKEDLPQTPQALIELYNFSLQTCDNKLLLRCLEILPHHFTAQSLFYDAYESDSIDAFLFLLNNIHRLDPLTQDDLESLKKVYEWLQNNVTDKTQQRLPDDTAERFLNLILDSAVSPPSKIEKGDELRADFKNLLAIGQIWNLEPGIIENLIITRVHFNNVTKAIADAMEIKNPFLLQAAFQHMLSPHFTEEMEAAAPPELVNVINGYLKHLGQIAISYSTGSFAVVASWMMSMVAVPSILKANPFSPITLFLTQLSTELLMDKMNFGRPDQNWTMKLGYIGAFATSILPMVFSQLHIWNQAKASDKSSLLPSDYLLMFTNAIPTLYAFMSLLQNYQLKNSQSSESRLELQIVMTTAAMGVATEEPKNQEKALKALSALLMLREMRTSPADFKPGQVSRNVDSQLKSIEDLKELNRKIHALKPIEVTRMEELIVRSVFENAPSDSHPIHQQLMAHVEEIITAEKKFKGALEKLLQTPYVPKYPPNHQKK